MHNPHSWYKKRLCHVIAHISLRPACYRCVKKIASKRFHFESYHNRRVRPKLASNSAQHASRSEDTGIRSASEHVRTEPVVHACTKYTHKSLYAHLSIALLYAHIP